jgi:hypothetical protein
VSNGTIFRIGPEAYLFCTQAFVQESSRFWHIVTV